MTTLLLVVPCTRRHGLLCIFLFQRAGAFVRQSVERFVLLCYTRRRVQNPQEIPQYAFV
jgi:hypothetical protein